MKNKRFLLLFCVALCTMLALALGACSDPPEHTHSFGEWSVTKTATCTEEGVMTRGCTCGEAETQPIPATGMHTYGVDNACVGCGARLAYTEGLEYELLQGGEAYAVAHIGAAVAEQIILPAYHEGKPVTALLGLLVKDGEVSAHRITSLELSANVTEVDPRAFAHCNDLEILRVAADNAVYHSKGNCLIQTASKQLIVGCKGSLIPADGSVTVIGPAAFCCNGALEELTVPAAVTQICPGAFEGCEALRSVTLKNAEGSTDPDQPNPIFGGWYVSETPDAEGGTAIDVADAANAANKLKGEYQMMYWFRDRADDTARY